MYNRKAQGMSFNYLVVVALGLIVLLIAGGIFVAKSNQGSNSLNNCRDRGGKCITAKTCVGNSDNDVSNIPVMGVKCDDDKQICCMLKIKDN